MAALGQSALDGFDPNANGTVNVVVVQPDGKILVGGDFFTLSPNGGAAVTRTFIARLNPDGTLDAAFNPSADSQVLSIALQPDGKILVGGRFSNIGGQLRNRLARLDSATGLADSFDPNASNSFANPFIKSIAVQRDGKIVVSGLFDTIGGQPRNYIARLDPDDGIGGFIQPEREQCCRRGRAAGGRQNPSGRLLLEHRWTTAQQHCPARCRDRPG